MRSYYKIMLGKKSVHAQECLEGHFIGADYGMKLDLTPYLVEDWREFNHELIPVYLKNFPNKSKIAAGLACGALWTISTGLQEGDIVVCPDGHARFRFGEVMGPYEYHPGEILPHRRKVKWFDTAIPRREASEALRSSTNSQGTATDLTQHAEEIEGYIAGKNPVTEDGFHTMDSSTSFALEKHLEDFLVQNWSQTELGKDYHILEEEGELVGQQYPSDTGPIDILAISKDKKTLLVVELKKGRASDSVVGQIQRYMGYVMEDLAEEDQQVKGVIIALDDDKKIRRALSVNNNIEFYRYQVNFKLVKS